MLIHGMWKQQGGEQDKAYIQFLINGMQDKDLEIRRNCAGALRAFRGTLEKRVAVWDELAIPAYITASRDGDAEIRTNAINGLAFSGRSELVTPIFVSALADNDRRVRLTAALTIRGEAIPHRHSPDVQFAKLAVPALIRMLRSDDSQEIHAAMTALQNFGPDAKAAVPALLEERTKKKSPPLGNRCCAERNRSVRYENTLGRIRHWTERTRIQRQD